MQKLLITGGAGFIGGNFVQIVQKRQGLYVACIEEIAFRMGYISAQQLLVLADGQGKAGYGAYLREVALEELGQVVENVLG